MSNPYNINSYQNYKNEYSQWLIDKNIRAAKRQEYLRRNPDAIKDYDLQRAKILISAVNMMDKSISDKSDNIGTFFESFANLGLGYGAIGGTTLGFFLQKNKSIAKLIENLSKNNKKS